MNQSDSEVLLELNAVYHYTCYSDADHWNRLSTSTLGMILSLNIDGDHHR